MAFFVRQKPYVLSIPDSLTLPPKPRIVLRNLLGFLDFFFLDCLFRMAGSRAGSVDFRPSRVLE